MILEAYIGLKCNRIATAFYANSNLLDTRDQQGLSHNCIRHTNCIRYTVPQSFKHSVMISIRKQ